MAVTTPGPTVPLPGVTFTFTFEIPQPNDAQGNPVPNVVSTFGISGISLNVAKAIRAGLVNRAAQAGITNVTVSRHQDTVDTISDTST